jgi:hypothetical protein
MRPKYFTYDRAFEKAFNRYKESLTDSERGKLKRKFEIFVCADPMRKLTIEDVTRKGRIDFAGKAPIGVSF